MQGQGEQRRVNKPVGGMPATDDEIREKYLERAIRELNTFTRDLQACDGCPRGNLMPVLGSGHPRRRAPPCPPQTPAGGRRGGRPGALCGRLPARGGGGPPPPRRIRGRS